MSLCSATGNSGFPIIVQGQINRAIIPDTSIVKATFKTSLSTRSIPRTYDPQSGYIDEVAGQDTFIFNGTPYLLQTAQVYDARNNSVLIPTMEGSQPMTGQPSFGLALSFTKQQDNYAGEKILIILIPIFNQATATNGAEFHTDIDAYFLDMISQTVSRSANSLGVFLNYQGMRIGYTTCIELKDSAPINLRVLLFSGYVIKSTTVAKFTSVPPLRLPAPLRNYAATAFRRLVGNKNELEVSQWSTEGFCYAGTLSVGDDKFSKRFTFYDSLIEPAKGPIRPGTENLRTTEQYKCIPLNKVKDISGGLVLIDPATGSRTTLTDQLAADEIAEQAALKEALPNYGSNGVRDFMFKFADIIAVIATVVIVAILYYTIGQRFHTTENAIAAVAVANAAVAVANGLQTQTQAQTQAQTNQSANGRSATPVSATSATSATPPVTSATPTPSAPPASAP
jgi:hypothetical protein